LCIVIDTVIWHSKSGRVDVGGEEKALSPSLIQGNKQKFLVCWLVDASALNQLISKAKNFLCCVKIRSTWKIFTVSGR
jgi:hypothetical protein